MAVREAPAGRPEAAVTAPIHRASRVRRTFPRKAAPAPPDTFGATVARSSIRVAVRIHSSLNATCKRANGTCSATRRANVRIARPRSVPHVACRLGSGARIPVAVVRKNSSASTGSGRWEAYPAIPRRSYVLRLLRRTEARASRARLERATTCATPAQSRLRQSAFKEPGKSPSFRASGSMRAQRRAAAAGPDRRIARPFPAARRRRLYQVPNLGSSRM